MVVNLGSILLMTFLIGLPIVGGLISTALKAKHQHELRMRALELGRPLPGTLGPWSSAPLALKMGVWVPIGVFLAALGVTGINSQVGPFAVVSAGVVGCTAVICATILTALGAETRSAGDDSGLETPFQAHHAKPPAEPDFEGFGVVGRRG